MVDLPTSMAGLRKLNRKLFQDHLAAKNAGRTEEAKRLLAESDAVQDFLSRHALKDLAQLAGELDDLRETLEALRQTALEWPFGNSEAPVDHERSFKEPELPDNDFEDKGPDEPAPEPKTVPSGTVPKVSKGWANQYTKLWKTIEINDSWAKTATAICKKIIKNQSRYAKAVDGTNVPWWFVAVIHSMECSLRFDQHLHNGDPLTGRTKRVPADRPPSGSPPFTWEQSVTDALTFDRVLGMTDWSLKSVLYHWHRYNGINNEYKRRDIPTPYLWSGSQHYRKGKYVADGKFDANAVSKQVGAAVLLKTLENMGAITVKTSSDVTGNPATAAGSTSTIDLQLVGAEFTHVKKELAYPGDLKTGDGGSGASTAAKDKVRKVQEWLILNDFNTGIDGDFGASTLKQLKRFQAAHGRPETGELDEETWVLLSKPMREALAPIEHPENVSFEDAVVRIAKQHVSRRPEEVGGNNRGPWVRLYMKGRQGSSQRWCAGFVCFIIAQVARDLKMPMPLKRQVSCDLLSTDAQNDSRFVLGSALDSAAKRHSALKPGTLFLKRRNSRDWTHVGIILDVNDNDFDTLEGNTDNAGGVDGANAKIGNRSYSSKDFVKLF